MRVPTIVPRARAACCHEHVFAAAREHPSLRAPAPCFRPAALAGPIHVPG